AAPTATYKITPRVIEVVLKDQKNVYNGTEIFDIKETSQFYEIKTADNQSHKFDQGKIIAITKQTAGSDVGKYDLTATIVNNNYTFAEGNTFIQIDAFEVLRREIYVDAIKTGVYNKGVHSYSYNSEIELSEETTHKISFTYATSGVNVGNYALNATFNGEDFEQSSLSTVVVSNLSFSDGTNDVKASNYSIVYNLSADITPADLKVEATKLSTEYNAQAQYPTLSILGVDDCDEQNIATISYSNDTLNWATESEFTASEFAMKNAGVHKVYVKVVAPNYKEFVTEQQSFEITKAPLRVTVADIQVVYGDNIQDSQYQLVYNQEDFFGSDNEQNSVTAPANVKDYFKHETYIPTREFGWEKEVSVLLGASKLNSANYNIQPTSGTIKVVKRDVIVTLDGLSGVYGNEKLNVKIASVGGKGMANYQQYSALSLKYLLDGQQYSASMGAKDYAITFDAQSANKNYNVTIDAETSKYTIEKRTAKIQFNGTTSVSGEFTGAIHTFAKTKITALNLVSGHVVSDDSTVSTVAAKQGVYEGNNGFDFNITINDPTAEVTSNYNFDLSEVIYTITNATFTAPTIKLNDNVVTNPTVSTAEVYTAANHIVKVTVDNTLYGEANSASVAYAINIANDRHEPADGEFSATLPQIKDAGDYEIWYLIKDKNGDYNPLKGYCLVTINKAQLAISVEGVAPITYGDPRPTFELIYSGLLGDDANNLQSVFVAGKQPKIVYGYNQGSNAGEYPVTIEGATSDKPQAANYEITTSGTKLVVNKKALSLDGKISGYEGEYDGNYHSVTVSQDIIDLVGEANVVYSNDNKFINANAEGYSVGVVVKESTNYLSASATATVIINKRTVKVSFENETENIIYGSKPSLTPQYDGFVKDSDNKINNSNIVYKVDGNIYNANVYLNASANAYQFTVDQIKNFNDQNYVLDFSSAKTAVSVEKQRVKASISAASESSYYGDTTQQVLARYQVKYSLENGNEVGIPAGINLSVYTTYTQGNNISDYDLVYFDNNESKVINDGEQVESTNYIVTVAKNTVHINQRALTVNVGNTGHTYGENESDLSAIISYEGQANLPDPEISLAILSQQARMFALRSAQPLNAGDYAISVYYTNENYKITFVGKIGNVDVNQTIEATQDGSNAISVAEYTVEPMQITVNVWNGNSAYGTLTDGDKLYEVPQLAYGQQEDVLDLSVTSLVGKDATTHDVSFSYNNPNYQIVVFNTVSKETFSVESGAEQPVVVSQHTITKQNVSISVSAENVIYGYDQTFNFIAQVNGEDYGLIDNNNLSATLQIYKLAAGSAELVDTISNVAV
ncbi:MAG: hypothetical protein IKA42_02055, partial [Clostridia bacterium]|nr:hypothetical protein [Clostridia bacterium]